jgi:uncharacterized integral membrane protein
LRQPYNEPFTNGGVLKYLTWLLKAVIFFVLFAFALNNQAPVDLHFFFGTQWRAPMVLVVLATFALGMFAGIAVMLPLWLSARRQVKATQPLASHPSSEESPPHGT